MKTSDDIVLLTGRILMAALFVLAGTGKMSNVAGFAQYLTSGGIPAILTWPAILFEILAGMALLVGWQTRIISLALSVFCLVTAMLYHFDPANQGQMVMFSKNLALAGGFLAFSVAGAGRWSFDARRG